MESDRESTPLNPTLAQLVEHMIVAHVVVGSNPASRIKSKTTDNKKVSLFYYLFIILL